MRDSVGLGAGVVCGARCGVQASGPGKGTGAGGRDCVGHIVLCCAVRPGWMTRRSGREWRNGLMGEKKDTK